MTLSQSSGLKTSICRLTGEGGAEKTQSSELLIEEKRFGNIWAVARCKGVNNFRARACSNLSLNYSQIINPDDTVYCRNKLSVDLGLQSWKGFWSQDFSFYIFPYFPVFSYFHRFFHLKSETVDNLLESTPDIYRKSKNSRHFSSAWKKQKGKRLTLCKNFIWKRELNPKFMRFNFEIQIIFGKKSVIYFIG